MKYNFDEVTDRRGTGSLKWEYGERSKDNDLLPMWLADMDFKSPPEIVDALKKRTEHGVFGYTPVPDSYYSAIIEWFRKQHGWDLEKEWIALTPGVLPAVAIAIQALTEPGDRILIQPPVYHPFRKIIQDNERSPVDNPLILRHGEYRIDYADLEKQLDKGIRMMILCSPHNPVGRVWKMDELRTLSEICLKHDIVIISDEIHSDLVMKGNKHIPLATMSHDIAENTITLSSASKTFNLPGLACANVIIPNKNLLDRFNKVRNGFCVGTPNLFGLIATEVAYMYGLEWLEQLLDYIEGNYRFLVSFIGENALGIKVTELEGTYLAWLDFRDLGLPDEEINNLLLKKAKVWLDNGPKFGRGGKGFQRLNLACPRETLEQGLRGLANVFADSKFS